MSEPHFNQRQFKGRPRQAVDFGMALISALVIYWTVDVMADTVVKRSLYLMMTLALGAIVYPFSKRSDASLVTAVDTLIVIMGAVAFIMAEFTQIPYLTIVAVATSPILLYFITLMVFIHFEAKKQGIGIDESRFILPVMQVLKTGWHFFFSLVLIIVAMAFGYPPAMAALVGSVSLVVIHFYRIRRFDLRLIYQGLVLGGQYALSIDSIVACIGIILALVGLNGIGLKVSWLLADLTHGMAFLAIFYLPTCLSFRCIPARPPLTIQNLFDRGWINF